MCDYLGQVDLRGGLALDDLDLAKMTEMADRERAIKVALSVPDHDIGETQDKLNGIVYCIDCANDIPIERLKIKPNAVRCVDCKEIWEKEK